MNPKILQKDNIRFLQIPIQTLKPKELPENIKILTADMNLPPKVVMQQCLKVARQLAEVETLFLTLKMPSIRLIKSLERYLKWCKSAGFEHTKALQLYYHRREILIVTSKKDLFEEERSFYQA